MTSPDTEFISILGASGSPEAPARVSARSLPDVLPILGLSDIVIFPGMVAPLLVETAQSTKLIDDVVGGDRLLGVVLQRNAEAENPLPHEMHEVGCAARVLKMLKFPDNTDRKSTRLNSSHLVISYAVFCLKKKKKTNTIKFI